MKELLVFAAFTAPADAAPPPAPPAVSFAAFDPAPRLDTSAFGPPPAAVAHPQPARVTPAYLQPVIPSYQPTQYAAPRQGVSYNASHQCPACGRSQYTVSGPGPSRGTHTHRCNYDGTVWWH